MPINRSVSISFKVEGDERKVTREQGIIEEIDSRKEGEGIEEKRVIRSQYDLKIYRLSFSHVAR